jgi:hypothetical protein
MPNLLRLRCRSFFNNLWWPLILGVIKAISTCIQSHEKFSECALPEKRACVAWIPGDVNTLLAGLRVHIHRFLTPRVHIRAHTAERAARLCSIVIVLPSNKAYWPISRRCSNLSIPAQHNAMFHMCSVCVSLIK